MGSYVLCTITKIWTLTSMLNHQDMDPYVPCQSSRNGPWRPCPITKTWAPTFHAQSLRYGSLRSMPNHQEMDPYVPSCRMYYNPSYQEVSPNHQDVGPTISTMKETKCTIYLQVEIDPTFWPISAHLNVYMKKIICKFPSCWTLPCLFQVLKVL